MWYHEEKRVDNGNRKPFKIREQGYFGSVGIKKNEEQPPEYPKSKVPPETVFSFVGKYKGILLHMSTMKLRSSLSFIDYKDVKSSYGLFWTTNGKRKQSTPCLQA